MNYSKLERKYKKMSKLKFDDEEDRLNINFISNHYFTVPKETYKKTITRSITVVGTFLVFIFMGIYSIFNNQNTNLVLVSISNSFFLLVIGLICYESYKLLHNVYPKNYLNYCSGQVEYCDGKKTYNFNVKEIFSLRFDTPFYKSSRWVINICINHSFKNISIDILNMNNPEIIFRLLTNFNKDIRI